MVYAAIGGMQLKRWTGYFRIIIPTLRVLKSAKQAEGCVHADTFKAGDVFFAVSVWETEEQLKTFGRSGLHGQLTQVAMNHMAMFFNHTEGFESIPNRDQAVTAWKAAIAASGGNGTIGTYLVSREQL